MVILEELLKGFTINDTINKIYNRKPYKIKSNLTYEYIYNFMQSNFLIHIPVVKNENYIHGLYVWKPFWSKQKIDIPVLIQAGGFGKRILPYTKNTPKPMLKIYGKPILEHIIINLKNNGFKKIYISTHYLKDKIYDYFKDGSRFGIKINYIEEKVPMGTCGSLSKLKNIENKEKYFLLNGDIICNLNFIEFFNYHVKSKAHASMATVSYKQVNPYGVIKSKNGKIIGFDEKPIQKSDINAGIYCFNRTAIDKIDKKKFNINQLFEKLIKENKKTVIYPLHENWTEIGTKEHYESEKRK